MSQDDISRIITKLDGVSDRVVALEVEVKGLRSDVAALSCVRGEAATTAGDVRALKAEHDRIQCEKLKNRIPWQNIVPAVISGIVMLIAGAVFAVILKG